MVGCQKLKATKIQICYEFKYPILCNIYYKRRYFYHLWFMNSLKANARYTLNTSQQKLKIIIWWHRCLQLTPKIWRHLDHIFFRCQETNTKNSKVFCQTTRYQETLKCWLIVFLAQFRLWELKVSTFYLKYHSKVTVKQSIILYIIPTKRHS